MNRLPTERPAQVLGCLVEGKSIRATVRVTGAAKNTGVKLLADAGAAFAEYQDGMIQNLRATRVEADEIRSFCYAKGKNVPEDFKGTPGYGDVWTWTAIDAETKLIPSWLVGERTMQDCYASMADVRSRIRPGHRIQLTTEGLGHYERVVSALWGSRLDTEPYGLVPPTREHGPVTTRRSPHPRLGGAGSAPRTLSAQRESERGIG